MYVDVVNGVNINQQTLHWGHPLLQKIRDATCALTSSELRPDLQLTIWGWCISPIKWWFWRQFIIDVIGTWNSHMNQICHKEFPCLTDLRRIIPACSVPLFPYTLLWSDFIFAATAMSLLNHNCPLCLNHLLKRWNMMKSMCWIVLMLVMIVIDWWVNCELSMFYGEPQALQRLSISSIKGAWPRHRNSRFSQASPMFERDK